MIRGKKNFLPPSYLIMGFSFLFKVDEQCVFRHRGERKVKTVEEDVEDVTSSTADLLEEGEELLGEDEGEAEGDDVAEEDSRMDGGEEEAETFTETQETSGQTQLEDVEEQDEEGEVDEEVKSKEEEESTDISFPDTTISLTHLQSNRGTTNPGFKQDVSKQDNTEPQGKKYISAKQRRDMKKKQKPESDEHHEEAEKQREDDRDSSATSQSAKTAGATQQVLKRGQKNKLKKIKDKYKDQDEEDRELMMKLLGSAGGIKEEKGKKGKKGKGKEEPVKRAPQKPPQKHREVKTAGNNAEGPQDTGPGGEGTTEQEDKEADDLDQDNPGAEEGENFLDSLTGQPHLEDVLLFAVPVCAPYTALSNYKHKVKLTPGTQKKGKAARTAVFSFMRAKETSAREKDLLRSVKDTDLSRNMPGKMKVSAPNLLAAKKK